MGDMTPTPLERQFLRGIAAVNPAAETGEEAWWPVRGLISTWPDFRFHAVTRLANLGKSCERKGMAAVRRAGRHTHAANYYAEYRITSYGRGLVADSCIGGGLPWLIAVIPVCPACRTASAELVAGPVPATLPAHPLPGYAPSVVLTEAQVADAYAWADRFIQDHTHVSATATEETR